MKVAIIGASGYTGGELIRLLYMHPESEINLITSRRFEGQSISVQHPNFRKNLSIKFDTFSVEKALKNDFIFLAVPHKVAQTIAPDLVNSGIKIIDLSADFRLKDPKVYEKYYVPHENPELLKKSVYGLPELHREEIKTAQIVATPGCMAATSILALSPIMKYPDLIDLEHIICDAKIGSSGGGRDFSLASHHPERKGVIRPYKPTNHRHTAEINQELSILANNTINVGFSAHAVDIVRGILSTCHVFLKKSVEDKDIWKIYREMYNKEPFIRIIKQKTGIYRLPDPKILIGSNYCDVGFVIDENINRLVVLGALDNLIKGAAGMAMQCFNIMNNFNETLGLEEPGFHPI
ncbi:MAG: N-acetyl-gamma-glutamyl-phosphate reductase [Candidatus Lokiarchaeota archaeon]|nr:N-acetyl-gamma-glutamyl-phosphate reductase [Candidatus Lokiarchaeota archaeon]